MSYAERRFAAILRDYLEAECSCWYDVTAGKGRRRRFDFMIFHPVRGLLLMEIRDWMLDSIDEFNQFRVILKTSRGLVGAANPLQQVRGRALQLRRELCQHSRSLQKSGSHRGKILVPCGYGVVMANISRGQFEAHEMSSVMQPNRVICQDEIQELSGAEVSPERLWQMLDFQLPTAFTPAQVECIESYVRAFMPLNLHLQYGLSTG